jgi:ATP-binding cassette subfamily B (MDR/TAP) protein 6
MSLLILRYQEALVAYQDYEFLSAATVSMLNLIQNLIIGVGLMAGSLLCAWMVAKGQSGKCCFIAKSLVIS